MIAGVITRLGFAILNVIWSSRKQWKKKMKAELKLFFVVAVLLVGTVGAFGYYVMTDGAACLINPYEYAVEKTEKDNNAQMYCSCSLIGEEQFPPLRLTNKGLKQQIIQPHIDELRSSQFYALTRNWSDKLTPLYND